MRYYSAPRRALRGVRQLLYPRRCPFCNAVLGSIRTCPDCAEEVDRLRRKPGIRLDASQHYLGGLSGAAAPFRYEGCVRRAILRAKYQAAPWTAVELGVVLAELAFGSEVRMRGAEPVPQRVEGARLGYDCIVPVPARCSHSRAGHLPPAEAPVPRPSSGPRCQRQALPAPRPAPPPSMVQPDTLPAGWPAARSPHTGTVPLRRSGRPDNAAMRPAGCRASGAAGPLLPRSPGRSLCCPAPHCRRGTDADKAAAVPRAVPGAGRCNNASVLLHGHDHADALARGAAKVVIPASEVVIVRVHLGQLRGVILALVPQVHLGIVRYLIAGGTGQH